MYITGKDADGFPIVDKATFDLPDNVELLDEKSEEIVKNPICRRFFTLIRFIGTLVMMTSLVADFAYVMKQPFSSKQLYIAYIAILCLRCILPILTILKSLCNKVMNKALNRLTDIVVEDEGRREQLQRKHTCHGYLLYTFMPLSFLTGSYRLLNFKNFTSEIGTGLALDFFGNTLPLLFV